MPRVQFPIRPIPKTYSSLVKVHVRENRSLRAHEFMHIAWTWNFFWIVGVKGVKGSSPVRFTRLKRIHVNVKNENDVRDRWMKVRGGRRQRAENWTSSGNWAEVEQWCRTSCVTVGAAVRCLSSSNYKDTSQQLTGNAPLKYLTLDTACLLNACTQNA